MKPGTQADIVREFGCSRTAISKLVKAKDYRIIYTPGGKIEVTATVKALKDSGFGKRSKKLGTKVDGLVGPRLPDIDPQKPTNGESEDSSGPEVVDIEKYIVDGKLKITAPRPIIERWKSIQSAEKDRIKNAKELKTLVDFNKTVDTVFNFIRPLRDDLLEVAKRVSPMAYMAGSKLDAEKIINDEINRIILSRVGDEYRLDDELKKKIIKVLKM